MTRQLQTDYRPQFNGRLYGPLGFTIADGPGVCYTFFDWEQRLKIGHVWRPSSPNKHIKRYLFIRDGRQCKYCGTELEWNTATIDHYFPPDYWQRDEADVCDGITNLVLSCQRCNFVKGKKSPIELRIYPVSSLLHIRVVRLLRRKVSHLRLIREGKMTISGRRVGSRRVTTAQRKRSRQERFI